MLRLRLVTPILLFAIAAITPVATRAQGAPPIVIHEGGDPTSWGYTPTTTSVPAGTTVTWTNSGAFPHDAASTDGSWKTALLDPGASGLVTFSNPGTYTYICTPHPWMQATIVVTAAASAPGPTPTPATDASAPAAPSDNAASQPTPPPAPDTGAGDGSN